MDANIEFSMKSKILNKQVTIGSWITFRDPAVVELMRQFDFDWLVIDLEHSSISISEAMNLISVAELSGISPLVRVGENNPYLIKRVLDAGAHGVVVPMVNNREDAVRAVASVKYPPEGNRGVGLFRAQKYGYGFEEYKQWLKNESIVVVQIEHVNAIQNLEEILTTDGVDASIIGPYDLSGSLGCPGDFSDLKLQNALLFYEETCRRLGKPAGYHVVRPNVDDAKQLIERGYSFLAVGVDFLFLGDKCRETMSALRPNRQ